MAVGARLRAMGYPVTGNRVQTRSYKAAVNAPETASDLPAGVGARLRAMGHAVTGNRVQARSLFVRIARE